MSPPRASRRDRLLLGLLYLALALILSRAHHENVDSPARAKRLALHEEVLEDQAPDPYQYKMFGISWAVEGVHRATGLSVFDVYAANELLALVALLAAHHLWLSRLYGTRGALLGTLLLCALAHGLFLDYYHHPYDLWGVAGFCVLLSWIEARRPVGGLCALALALGVVWEKHALLPLVYAALRRRDGLPWRAIVSRAAAFIACSVAWYVGVRLGLGSRLADGSARGVVDVTSLAEQDWGKVLAHQAPYVLPFVVLLVAAFGRVPPIVRLAWIYVPAMFAAYLASQFILHELRSFWAFAPIFTATAVAWARGLPDAPAPVMAEAPPGEPAGLSSP